MIALPIDGASMNPARSAAPALVAGRLESLWIYIVGPLIGAAAAVAIAIVLHGIGPEDGEAEAAAQGAAGRQDR